jgi:ribonuclease J
MERNVSVAQELGYLRLPEGSLVTVEATREWDPSRVVLITTGSQGEPAAALSRIAAGEHRQIRILAGDTVVMAATPVPGNEESVSRTIDNLFRAGAEVLYPRTTPNIHVSGHAARDEHVELLQIIRPRYAAPFHGEYRMMVLYRRLAEQTGLAADSILMPELGDVLEFRPDSARIHGRVPAGSILVDGITVGAVTQVMLRDRRHLAADGIVVVSAVVDGQTGKAISEPEIMTRGLPHLTTSDLLDGARGKVARVLQRRHLGEVEHRLLGDLIKESLGAYIYGQTGLRPMILPVVTEI